MAAANTDRRKRRLWSVRAELLHKSREAALAAVQLFNNPQIGFKSELFIVIMHIAWTYLMHAYYRMKHIEYRYYGQHGSRRRFNRTKHGAFKCWELDRCISVDECPLDRDTSNNLRFLIGIRHEIEHQMTTRIDDSLSGKFQACCLNYNHWIKKLFGDDYAIDRHLALSLQFSAISRSQAGTLSAADRLPGHIRGFIDSFEGELSDAEYNSTLFSYRAFFVPKTANRKGQADEVIEFIPADSELAEGINKSYALIKEVERPKYLPGQVVRMMHDEGYHWFTMHQHTALWKKMDAKKDGKGYGWPVAGTWYWYERWVDCVRQHCEREQEVIASGPWQ